MKKNEKVMERTLKEHQEVIAEFADKLHELVWDMKEAHISTAEVMGILEVEKAYRIDREFERAKVDTLIDNLMGMMDGDEGDEED